MSEIRVNKIVDEPGTGAVELKEGATLPAGKTLSGDGNINITGNATIGGLLTYEDVTNIDAVGLITARSGIQVLAGISTFKGAHFDGGNLIKETYPAVVLNCTGFAVSSPGSNIQDTPFHPANCPVFQVILSGGTLLEWQESKRGLSPKDLAMNVALPEVDGRLITRAISFKKSQEFDEATEVSVIKHEAVHSRIDFVVKLAASWARLRITKTAEKRIALVMANYPNKDGRLGNGAGNTSCEQPLTRVHNGVVLALLWLL